MSDQATPVAARMDAAAVQAIQTDANLRLQVTGSTRKFQRWQQIPAWLLGFAALALGFTMVVTGYDSAAGWFAVSTSVVLAVVASFRSPFSLGESAVSTAPSPRPRKKPAPPVA